MLAPSSYLHLAVVNLQWEDNADLFYVAKIFLMKYYNHITPRIRLNTQVLAAIFRVWN